MSASETPAPRLGRGLDSLISRTVGDQPESSALEVALDSIRVNPQQPRRRMNEEALGGLAASISQHGILQPIVVRRRGAGYELVAGERRFRASRIAGKTTIPVVLVTAEGTRSLELALIENIQRENLTALDEAEAYQQLLGQYGLTHQELAEQLGRSRAAISNGLRLLDLPDEIQHLLDAGRLPASHARAILGLESQSDMIAVAKQACDEGWSTRQVEARVRAQKPVTAKRSPRSGKTPQKVLFYEEKLMKIYDTKVSLHGSEKTGEVRLTYHSKADRDRLVHQLLTGQASFGDG